MRSSILTSKRAKTLRREMTKPETMLWTRLRRQGDGDPPFRRQHAVGPYILDFYCAKAKLAVEIDGEMHSEDEHLAHDERRDRGLATQGIAVLRIAASSVYRDVGSVADGVRLRVLARLRGEG